MIFLVSVIIYREIISIEMFHMGNPVFMTQVSASWSNGEGATVPDSSTRWASSDSFCPSTWPGSG